MIEIAEAKYITAQIDFELKGMKIVKVEVNRNPHSFAWFNKSPAEYEQIVQNQKIKEAKSSGSMMRIILESEDELVFGEDIVFSYHDQKQEVGKNQLMLYFDHGMVLEIRTKLYGFFLIAKMDELISKNQYFSKAVQSIGVMDKDFTFDYFIN